jgi:hypothetical protein
MERTVAADSEIEPLQDFHLTTHVQNSIEVFPSFGAGGQQKGKCDDLPLSD